MKTKLLLFIVRKLRAIADRVEDAYYRAEYLKRNRTNPHEQGSISWHLWNDGARLEGEIVARSLDAPNPWVELPKDNWPSQMGDVCYPKAGWGSISPGAPNDDA